MYYALKVQLKRDRASIAPPQNSVFCAHRNTWKYDDFDISTLSICPPPQIVMASAIFENSSVDCEILIDALEKCIIIITIL